MTLHNYVAQYIYDGASAFKATNQYRIGNLLPMKIVKLLLTGQQNIKY